MSANDIKIEALAAEQAALRADDLLRKLLELVERALDAQQAPDTNTCTKLGDLVLAMQARLVQRAEQLERKAAKAEAATKWPPRRQPASNDEEPGI